MLTHTAPDSLSLSLVPPFLSPPLGPLQLRSQEAWADFPAPCPRHVRGDNCTGRQMPRAQRSLHERSRPPLEVPPGPASQGSYDLIPALLAFAAWIPNETK